ncbi:MAG: hypothetical protein L3J52_08515 [Proteobacteria bacterium]|nr:hypothetical protein [Pseudomonadota bacterium]
MSIIKQNIYAALLLFVSLFISLGLSYAITCETGSTIEPENNFEVILEIDANKYPFNINNSFKLLIPKMSK